MKGKIITGRPVLVEDFEKQGMIQIKPVFPRKTKNSRYWRQHKEYTHIDESGMEWQFENGRPISELADRIMNKLYKK